jgi:hypothetical protein
MVTELPQHKPKSTRAVLWLVLALLGGFALVLLIAALVIVPRLVRGLVVSTAKEHGVVLDPGELGFGLGWVQLDHPKLSLDGVRALSITVERIDIALSGFSPTSIELSKPEIVVTGSLTNVALELSDWAKAHDDAFSLPFTAQGTSVHFLENAGEKPWLDVAGGTLTRTASGGAFSAERATLGGVSLGKVGAGFSQTSSLLTLGFGETDPARARIKLELAPKATPPTAKITLAPTPAPDLEKPLGLRFLGAGVKASATVDLVFPTGADAGSVTGKTHVTLDGYVPPHPLELDGFIFGNVTTFDTDFALPKIRDRVLLTNSVLTAGAFVLRGSGLVARSPDHSEMTLDLRGNLPCDALAGAAAQARSTSLLGKELAARAGDLARHLVSGSVAVGLKVHADSKNLGAAHLEREIGIGCGLRPLSLAELARLVPLPSDLGDLVSSLPALPQGLPQLPGLPGFPPGLASSLPALPSGFPPPTLPTALPTIPNLGFPLPPPAPSTGTKPPPKPPGKSSASGGSGG